MHAVQPPFCVGGKGELVAISIVFITNFFLIEGGSNLIGKLADAKMEDMCLDSALNPKGFGLVLCQSLKVKAQFTQELRLLQILDLSIEFVLENSKPMQTQWRSHVSFVFQVYLTM